MSQRLYLQYVPDKSERQPILAYQQRLYELVGGRPLPASELHLTLLHIGIIDAVLTELRGIRPELQATELHQALAVFVAQVTPLLPAAVQFQSNNVELFGSTVVLRGDVDEVLQHAHRRSLALLKTALQACLRSDPTEFMRSSHNFSHALEFAPHISLLRSVKTTTVVGSVKPLDIGLRLLDPATNLRV